MLFKAEINYFEIEADTEESAAQQVAQMIRDKGFVVYVAPDHEDLDSLLHGYAFPPAKGE